MKSIKVTPEEMSRRMARFRNLGSYVPTREQSDRIAYQPELREEIERKHGKQTVDALDRIGVRFDAGMEWAAKQE